MKTVTSAGLILFFLAVDCYAPSRASAQNGENTTPIIVADVVYGHKLGMALTYDVIKPNKPNGAGVAFMVSGGWVSQWIPPTQAIKFPLFQRMVDQGYTLFLVRHGSSPLFKVPDAADDVRMAIRTIRKKSKEHGIDEDRLGVMGASAGGHLSLLLGTTARDDQSRVAAVAAFFPPTDLRIMVGPSKDFPALDFDKSKADAVSPLLHVSDDDAPTLLVHGTTDRLVPISHSKNIQAEFEKTKAICKLIVIEGAGHGFRGDDAETAYEAIIKWFGEHLQTKDVN